MHTFDSIKYSLIHSLVACLFNSGAKDKRVGNTRRTNGVHHYRIVLTILLLLMIINNRNLNSLLETITDRSEVQVAQAETFAPSCYSFLRPISLKIFR